MGSPPNVPDNEDNAPSPVDISMLDINQLVEVFIMLLSEQAWRYIGLHVDPRTNKISKDLSKAHIAIECITALVEKIEPGMDKAEVEHLRRLITDLQLNFAEQSK